VHGRGGARSVLYVLGGLFVAATIAWTGINLVDLMAHERTRTPLSFPPGVSHIRVDQDGGSLQVTATDGDTVTGERRVDRGLRAAHWSEEVQGDTLVLRGRCPSFVNTRCGVASDLAVPAGTSVTADASGGGITVRGVTGELTLDSSGGGITLEGTSGAATLDASGGGIRLAGVSGPVDAMSSGGGVSGADLRGCCVSASSSGGGVRLSFASAPRQVTAHSSGGGVTIEVPKDPTSYQVTARSSSGQPKVGVRTDPDSAHTIDARSTGGGVTVRYP
jgi:hypothetical protein